MEIFSSRPILRHDDPYIIFIFVILSSFAALFTLLSAQQKKGFISLPCTLSHLFNYFQATMFPLGPILTR